MGSPIPCSSHIRPGRGWETSKARWGPFCPSSSSLGIPTPNVTPALTGFSGNVPWNRLGVSPGECCREDRSFTLMEGCVRDSSLCLHQA